MKLVRHCSFAAACVIGLLACRGNDRGAQTTTTAASPERNGSTTSRPQPTPQPTPQPYGQEYGQQPYGQQGTSTTTGTTTTTGTSTDTGTDTGLSTGSGMGTTGSDTSGTGSVRASMIAYQTAASRITEAHCDREASCDQIGTNRRFATRERCVRDQGKKTQQEVKAADCPNGIDENRLQTCLGRIGVQECTDLVMSLANVDACSTATLCKR